MLIFQLNFAANPIINFIEKSLMVEEENAQNNNSEK